MLDISMPLTFPPITNAAEKWWLDPTLFKTSNIWYASSLVGVMIRAPKPSKIDHPEVKSCSSI